MAGRGKNHRRKVRRYRTEDYFAMLDAMLRSKNGETKFRKEVRENLNSKNAITIYRYVDSRMKQAPNLAHAAARIWHLEVNKIMQLKPARANQMIPWDHTTPKNNQSKQ